MRKAGDFGAPKVLPGQLGYRLSEADVLEKDAKEMEVRLKQLQERMLQQQLEDESTPKVGGARWKSARSDKGSVLSYGKDMQEKYKKKREAEGGGDPVIKAAAQMQARKTMAASKPVGDYRTKDVTSWNVVDVSDWLHYVGLSQYSSSFGANEITGPILLDISLEDLDYMGITVLGHRKTILKGIEDLRMNKSKVFSGERANNESKLDSNDLSLQKMTHPLNKSLSSESRGRSDEKSMSIMSQSMDTMSIKDNSKLKHWSRIEPLSSGKVENPGGMAMANAADDDDVFDEEAERKAFQEAVLEWRKAGNSNSDNGSDAKVAIEKDGRIVRPSSSSTSKGPVMNDEDYDIGDEENAFNSIAKDSQQGLSKEGTWNNPFAPSSSVPSKKSPARVNHKPAVEISSSNSLFHGHLDEEAEHLEFQKAVEAWRNKKSDSDNGTSSVSTSFIKSSVSNSGKQIAERIAKELEEQQQAMILNLQRRKEIESRKLAEANERLRQQRNISLAQSPSSMTEDLDDELSDDYDDNDYLSRDGSINNSPMSAAAIHPTSPDSKMTSCKIDKSLIQSFRLPKEDMDENISYIVEEASSDDDE